MNVRKKEKRTTTRPLLRWCQPRKPHTAVDHYEAALCASGDAAVLLPLQAHFNEEGSIHTILSPLPLTLFFKSSLCCFQSSHSFAPRPPPNRTTLISPSSPHHPPPFTHVANPPVLVKLRVSPTPVSNPNEHRQRTTRNSPEGFQFRPTEKVFLFACTFFWGSAIQKGPFMTMEGVVVSAAINTTWTHLSFRSSQHLTLSEGGTLLMWKV